MSSSVVIVRKRRGEDGAYLAMATVLIVVMMLVLGASYETAQLMEVNNSLQTAVDAGVAAGVKSLQGGASEATARAHALIALNTNLDANGLDKSPLLSSHIPVITANDAVAPLSIAITARYPVRLSLLAAAAQAVGIPISRDVRVRSGGEVPIVAAMLVMDVSTSMNGDAEPPSGGPTRYQALRSALPGFVTSFGARNATVSNNHLGLITFGGDIDYRIAMDDLTSAHETAMQTSITALPTSAFGGNTNLSEALERARKELLAYAAPGARKEILFMTDGAPAGGLLHLTDSSVRQTPVSAAPFDPLNFDTHYLPARADADTGSNYSYRVRTGTYPKTMITPGVTLIASDYQAGGHFAVVSADGLAANVYSGSRLENPSTNLPPSTCGTIVEDGYGNDVLAHGVVGARIVTRNCTLANVNCSRTHNYTNGYSQFTDLRQTNAVQFCEDYPGCPAMAAQEASGPWGWCKILRQGLRSSCLAESGEVALRVDLTREIDGTTLNRDYTNPAGPFPTCAAGVPASVPMLDGVSQADVYELQGNAWMIQSALAHEQGIRVHGVVVGDASNASSFNGPYQGSDENLPRRHMMYYLTRQKYQREAYIAPLPAAPTPTPHHYAVLKDALGTPQPAFQFPQLAPLPLGGAWEDDSRNTLLFTPNANLSLMFRSFASSRTMSFTSN